MRAAGIGILCLALLAGCGFQLRGNDQAAMPMDTLALAYPGGRYPLADMLRDALVARNVRVPEQAADHLTLQLTAERLNRRAVTLNNRGGAGQYELTLEIDAFVLMSGNLIAGPETLAVTGSFYEDTANISGSNNGVEQTLDDMRRELAEQIVRRLRLLSL